MTRHGKRTAWVGMAFLLVVGAARADDKADRQTQQKELERKADPFADRKKFLEDRVKELNREIDDARKAAEDAKQEADLARAVADENAKKVEELTLRLNELRQSGPPLAWPLHYYEKRPAPELLANLRGEVTEVADELVIVSVGINAGLAVGNEFDVYRLEGGGRYLGTAKVRSALNLFPTQAILTFKPARDVPLEKLKAEELPKPGDEVRPHAEPKK